MVHRPFWMLTIEEEGGGGEEEEEEGEGGGKEDKVNSDMINLAVGTKVSQTGGFD